MMMIPFKLFHFLSIFLLFLHRSSLATATISISLSRNSIPKSGDPITIKWSGIDSPTELDWLGIYSPANSSTRYFLGYLFLSSSPDWRSGSGSITIPLLNLRSDYRFRIFHWTESEINPKKHDHDHNPLPGTKHLLAESETVTFESGKGPEQVHLALTGRDGEMRAMFVTADGKPNFVKYGLSREKLDTMVRTQTSRYEREDMCDAPANQTVGWRDPGFIHDGVMTNLEQGKRYYYQVGSGAGGWGKVQTFVSPIKESNETMAFLFGDMGTALPYATYVRTQDESISTIKWISRDIEALGDKPALISHIGDISYARGYSWLWDSFFNQIEPVASQVPYHVCIGNHEYDWPDQPWRPDWAYPVYGTDGGGECGVPYSLRFHMPGNSSELTGMRAPATRNLYYSFDMGVVHFVYFSTETNFLSGSKQYEFLKTDLELVNRSRTPYVVVQGHRPMYTTSHETRDIPFNIRLQAHLEPLFVDNNVTLVLWGHVHRYERFCPLNNYSCGSMGNGNADPNWKRYPVHLVIGMAGQDWQPIWEPRPNHPDDPIFPQPLRSMYRGGEFGYIRLEANREKLTVSYVGNHDGEVHDSVEILASGQVFNGQRISTTNGNGVGELERLDTRSSWHIKVASVLVLGAFVGYVLGYVSRCRKDPVVPANWTPVKTEDI